MENYFSLYFLGISIFILSLIYFNKQSLFNFSYLLFGIGILALFCNTALNETISSFFISSISVLIIAFLIGKYNSSKEIYKHLLAVTICSLPIVLSWSANITVQDYTFKIGPIHLVLILYGGLINVLSVLKYKILNRFVKHIDKEDTHLAFQLIFLGIGVYVGSFFASFFGVLLIALGATVSSFQTRDFKISLFTLTYSIFAIFIVKQNIEVIDLSLGKILFGFVLGVFSLLIFNLFSHAEKNSILNLLFPTIVQSLLVGLIIWLGTQKTDLGGFDAYLASLFGIISAQLFTGVFIKNLYVIVLSLAVGLGFAVMIKPNLDAENQNLKLPEIVSSSNSANKKAVDPFDLPGKNLEEITGNYKIDDTNSELTFQLGPKGGKTIGAIKLFTGQIKLTKVSENSEFKVEMPVNKLTTFNAYRDESLMEASYFNVAKFPKMNYWSKKMVAEDDYYTISGDFEMLGIKQNVDVNVKYLGKNEKGVPILIGKSSLDRTLFGMKPDPKEGNVVDFQFKIELLEIKP